jgi:hypothetical protein
VLNGFGGGINSKIASNSPVDAGTDNRIFCLTDKDIDAS